MAGLNQDSGCCGSDAKLSRVGGPVTPRVREILSWYRSENPGVQANLARLLCSGNLSGTGKMVILPVDQGFEHGPARSFGMNPPAYDPLFHYQLAIDSGCNAYAAPIGFLTAGAADYAGSIPLILKLNNSDSLYKPTNPQQAVSPQLPKTLGQKRSRFQRLPSPGILRSLPATLDPVTAALPDGQTAQRRTGQSGDLDA